MSLFGSLGKLVSKGASAVGALKKIPFIGSIPIVGNAISLAAGAATIYEGVQAFGGHSGGGGGGAGGSGSGLPTLPGGLPALPGAAQTTTMALPMPGGGSSMKTVHLSPMMPQDKGTLDAWIAAGLIIPFNQLHTAFRAPKGFRVCHVNGMTIAVRSDVARKMHLVKPTHKPPISAGEWHGLKKAQRTIKKVKKVHGIIKYVHDHTTTHGQVKIAAPHHHKKGAKK